MDDAYVTWLRAVTEYLLLFVDPDLQDQVRRAARHRGEPPKFRTQQAAAPADKRGPETHVRGQLQTLLAQLRELANMQSWARDHPHVPLSRQAQHDQDRLWAKRL